jgi:arginase family enzyme
MDSNYLEIYNYIAPIHPATAMDLPLSEQHIGKNITIATKENPDIDNAQVVIVGCGEFRNQYPNSDYGNGPDAIREAFYQSYYWHKEIKIADLGNVIQGEKPADTYAALLAVITELNELGKEIIILGGSHDITLQQYLVHKQKGEIIDMAVLDMLADVESNSNLKYENHLLETLTTTPNYIRNFSLLGFQSYYVNPNVIETLDQFGFDCLRVGKAREKMNEIEPILRMSSVCSIDINAIRFSDAPANRTGSPNGFYGDEMCKITRYAGMSKQLTSLGIYGYQPKYDTDNITAKLIAQMLWYYIDGMLFAAHESNLDNHDGYLDYNISFTDQNILFKKSKKTNRWWMQLPEGKFVPCTYEDYLQACNNEIPERWIREVERSV